MRKITILLALAAMPLAAVAAQRAYVASSPVIAAETTVLLHGTVVLNEGKATVTLPEWFETDVKADGRSVLVSGRANHTVWASAIENGKFTVQIDENGALDATVSWLVAATRKQ